MEMKPVPDMPALADALGAIRVQIRALKAREAELRAALLAARPNGTVAGRQFEVELRESTRRVLDRARLPSAILDDERFWKTSVSQTLLTRALKSGEAPGDSPAAVPGAGVPRPRQAAFDFADDPAQAQDDLVLFEDF